MDYSRVIDRLIARQLRDWDVAGANYASLASAITRTLHVGEATIVLQFNPERRRSSAAAIDKKSLAQRECFLCREHQPTKQKTVLWGDHYKIQLNPYPIFSRHLTIADLHHEPQRIAGRVGDMLLLAKALPDFVVFYNGPQCGASAPDHAHFQAGAKGEMPLCDELSHATTHLLADGDEGFIGVMPCDCWTCCLYLRMLVSRWSMCCAGGAQLIACGEWLYSLVASIALPATARKKASYCSALVLSIWVACGPSPSSRTLMPLPPRPSRPFMMNCAFPARTCHP